MKYRIPTIEEMFQEARPVDQVSIPEKKDHSIWIILGVGVVVISGFLLYDHFYNSDSTKSNCDDDDQN
jgi:hypothetical protein